MRECIYCGKKFRPFGKGKTAKRFCSTSHQKMMFEFNATKEKPLESYSERISYLRRCVDVFRCINGKIIFHRQRFFSPYA